MNKRNDSSSETGPGLGAEGWDTMKNARSSFRGKQEPYFLYRMNCIPGFGDGSFLGFCQICEHLGKSEA